MPGEPLLRLAQIMDTVVGEYAAQRICRIPQRAVLGGDQLGIRQTADLPGEFVVDRVGLERLRPVLAGNGALREHQFVEVYAARQADGGQLCVEEAVEPLVPVGRVPHTGIAVALAADPVPADGGRTGEAPLEVGRYQRQRVHRQPVQADVAGIKGAGDQHLRLVLAPHPAHQSLPADGDMHDVQIRQRRAGVDRRLPRRGDIVVDRPGEVLDLAQIFAFVGVAVPRDARRRVALRVRAVQRPHVFQRPDDALVLRQELLVRRGVRLAADEQQRRIGIGIGSQLVHFYPPIGQKRNNSFCISSSNIFVRSAVATVVYTGCAGTCSPPIKATAYRTPR